MKKWYKHNPESTLENRAIKLLCDFEIETYYNLGLTIKPSDNQEKKNDLLNSGFCRPGRLQSKIKRNCKER